MQSRMLIAHQIGVIALIYGEIKFLKASVLGGILVNALLCPSICFIIGGMRRPELEFTYSTATMSMILGVATVSLLLPSIALSAVPSSGEGSHEFTVLSHGVAIVLLLTYAAYLNFQLRSHVHLFDDAFETGEVEEEEEVAMLSPWAACVVLALAITLVVLCAQGLIGSLDSVVSNTGGSRTFIGFIIIPFAGNTSRILTAIVVARKDHMPLAVQVGIGNSLEVVLLVAPLLVVVGSIFMRNLMTSWYTSEIILL